MGNKKSTGGPPFRQTLGDPDEKIILVRRSSCRIGHGAYSWFLTFGANVLTAGQSPPLEHHWLAIQTDKAWYCVQQWCNGSQIMEQFNSERECDLEGLSCAAKSSDSTVWTESTICPSNCTLGKVIDFIDGKEFGLYYDKFNHNCQHFCSAIINYIR